MKKATICLALLLVACLLGGSALAAASVSYEGGAEKFVFLPGSDLFESFKNVLPGDELTQTITVRNDKDMQVRIYLRAEPVNQASEEFLSQLTLTVTCKDKEIFDAAASETAQLTKATLLGTFRKNGSTDLTVTLSVRADMGNEYMSAIGFVPWTFIAEEIPDDETPHTGDWFQLGWWLLAAAIIVVAIAVVLWAQKRRKAN